MSMIQLCNYKDCTGCSACSSYCGQKAIQMHFDKKGFLRPIIDVEKCVACGACVKVCPILNEKEIRKPTYQTARKGWAKDDGIISKSSSGGIFSLLAALVLEKKGHVYGACFDRLNWRLHHVKVDRIEDLELLRGSKYLQSELGETYKEVRNDLGKGVIVLYVGTPCQIAGLHFYLRHKEYPNLLTVDLVCHGVPSPDVFKAYTNYLEKTEKSKLVNYQFREKRWCWTRFNSLAIFENGSESRGKWEEDLWMRGFLRELFLRDSCYNCRFANMNRQGDITLADYWAYRHKHGEIRNKEKGCSLILMNNDKGRNLIDQVMPQMISYPMSIEEACMGNQALKRCFPKNPLSDSFWNDFFGKGFEGIIDKYLYPEPIPLHYRLIYKYGKDSLFFQSYLLAKKIYHTLKTIIDGKK